MDAVAKYLTEPLNYVEVTERNSCSDFIISEYSHKMPSGLESLLKIVKTVLPASCQLRFVKLNNGLAL